MESLGVIIPKKNHMTQKTYPTLPQAFMYRNISAVIEKLKESGYDVFDVVVGGKHANMARKQEVEIYFNNNEAVFTVSDYGRVEGRVFPIMLEGVYHTNNIPTTLWCKV